MRIPRAVRRVIFGLVFVVAANLLVLGALVKVLPDPLAQLQTTSNDQLMTSSADKLPKASIVIAAVDDFSLSAYGRDALSWDRTHYAELLQQLKKAGAQVVAFDEDFSTPATDPRQDLAFAQAINDVMNPRDGSKPMLVILPHTGQGDAKYVIGKGLQWDGFDTLPPVLAAAKPIEVAHDVDPSGITVRELPLLETDGKAQLLPLPLVTASAFMRNIPGFTADLEFEDQPYRLHLGPYQIPIDEDFRMPMYFFSKPLGYHNTAFSIAKIASGQVNSPVLNNSIVIVGAYEGTGLAEDYPVPTSESSKMDRVEIWANATQALIQGKFIWPQPAWSTAAWMLGFSLVAAVVFFRFGAAGWVVTGVLAVGYTAARYLLTAAQLQRPVSLGTQQVIELPDIAYTFAGVILSSLLLFIYLFVDEQRRRSAVYSTFGRYVTPAVAQQLSSMQASGALNLGGSRRMATIMFGNLYPPHGTRAEDLLPLLNRYWDGIVHLVNENGGTVNKFIGDHIMVMFNVPLDLDGHAAAGARAAYQAVEWVKEARKAWPGQEATFGVGVNSGPLVAGNMGSQNRMEFTVLGDTVNTASRLSGVAKDDEVIISAATAALMEGSGAKIEDRGEVRVKGKAEPVKIYAVLGFGDPGPVQILQPVSVAAG
ncbi:MAG: adenylate/guanylate cyclase domain-containing protein [Chloroflexi bacterium]|nr:adenylate/guanylate cyclase domain-containing protein [Chloroflexota bacterium]